VHQGLRGLLGGKLNSWPEDAGGKLEQVPNQKSMSFDIKKGLLLFNGTCAHAVNCAVCVSVKRDRWVGAEAERKRGTPTHPRAQWIRRGMVSALLFEVSWQPVLSIGFVRYQAKTCLDEALHCWLQRVVLELQCLICLLAHAS